MCPGGPKIDPVTLVVYLQSTIYVLNLDFKSNTHMLNFKEAECAGIGERGSLLSAKTEPVGRWEVQQGLFSLRATPPAVKI